MTHLVQGVNAHDGCSHQTNCAGYSVAVLIQFIESSISGLHQIHAHAIDHVPEGLDVHWELADCVCKRRIQYVVWSACKDALQPFFPAIKSLQTNYGT